MEDIILEYFKQMDTEELGHSWALELDNVQVLQCFSGAGLEEVLNKFTWYNSLSDSDNLIKSEFDKYMAHPNIKKMMFFFLVQVLPNGISLRSSGRNNLTK